MKAKNIIEDDESAIVISTDNKGLKISTADLRPLKDWIIDKNLTVNKAIINKLDKATDRTEDFLGKQLNVFPSTKILVVPSSGYLT